PFADTQLKDEGDGRITSFARQRKGRSADSSGRWLSVRNESSILAAAAQAGGLIEQQRCRRAAAFSKQRRRIDRPRDVRLPTRADCCNAGRTPQPDDRNETAGPRSTHKSAIVAQ